MAKYSIDATVSELMENEESMAVLKEVVPGMINSPMIGMAKGMPLRTVLSFAGGKVPPEKVAELEKKLAELG